MPTFEITTASADDITVLGEWAHAEGWNPGLTDGQVFFATDPCGFLIGRLDGEPVSSVSVMRYGTSFGFLGFYLTRPSLRGRGYGIQVWRAGTARLSGRTVGLDGVPAQQDNYRRSGFRTAWGNARYEGLAPRDVAPPAGVSLVDARSLPFARLTAYDRRFFPEPRDSFLAPWATAPRHTALAAVRDGEIVGFAVLRACRAASRIGPLHAESAEVAAALVSALASSDPDTPVAIDVPDVNPAAVPLAEQLGLTPSFDTARMYTGPVPDFDRAGVFGITSLELG
ncbi:GNAT family N-acetyltransferase [Streptomyces nitrosporeus]|uniref:GNAT family N-acetyltransferase n=1 Tax=Streptomyces nitrosporeus TaxID=28894 RepID=A0A5J6FNT2_9ACTN|nr:GNAT family N-acetyltransferase [Streptomyces nitrosporeus]QEU76615.1 GNAT family N-acetyltransferase [Streptomyces nitrosporeus]GGZ12755.1 N-acetyltransferase GCN5 [Streptomyces nitrosporeus]